MSRWIFLVVIPLFQVLSLFAQEGSSPSYALYESQKAKFNRYEKEHRKFADFENHRVSYLSWGEPSERVFVWLPGSLQSAYDFYPFAEVLVLEGFQVLSVDHYGHGLTPIPEQDLDFWDFADDLLYILDQHQAKKVVLGGFSRGAYIATAFYDKYPERVEGLILEDGGTVAFKSMFDNMSPKEYAQFFQNIEAPKAIADLLFREYDSEFTVFKNIASLEDGEDLWRNFGFIRSKGDKFILYHDVNSYMHMQDSVHYAEVLSGSEHVSRYASSMSRVKPMQVFRNLNVPMFIMEAVGEPDLFDTGRENQQLQAMHPRLIQLKQFDCDGHNIHYSCPEVFLSELLRFLKEIHP